MKSNTKQVRETYTAGVAELTRAVGKYFTDYQANPRWVRQRHLRGEGPVKEFETAIARLDSKKYCLAVNSATNGLLVVALATGLVRKEIITTPQSYGATLGPFLLLRNRLRFGRVDANGNLTPDSSEELITPRTKAILAVDYDGQPHDSAAFRDICERHGLIYLADAAQSFGRRLPSGRHASGFADALVLSFGPGKPLCCGEGGAILTDSDAIYKECVRISQHPERYRFEYSLRDYADIQPINARMHPLAAIMGLTQLTASTSPSKARACAAEGQGTRPRPGSPPCDRQPDPQ